MQKTKHNKKSRFWLIYGIAALAGAIAVSVFLAVFYDVMAAYEASQPQTAAEEFAAALSAEKVSRMSEEAVGTLELRYESCEDYTRLFAEAFDPEGIICRKLLTESAADAPVYSIICRDTELLRLTLADSGDGRYGFSEWTVESVRIPLEGITENGKSYTVYAPHGSSLSVNGITAEPSEKNTAHPLSGELEAASLPSCDRYDLGTLYSEPKLVCTVDGAECSYTEQDGAVVCLAPGLSAQSYTVSAPTGAAVYVNGVLLGEKYIEASDVPYEYSPLDEGKDGLPTYTVYSTGSLLSSPTVTSELNGEALSAETDGGTCVFAYPESLTYSLTVKVPSGALVSVGGVDMSTLALPVTTDAMNGLDTALAALPTLDVYTVTGLYTADHEVTATLDGAALVLRDESEGCELVRSADHSSVVDSGVSEFVLGFIKAYFHYTSQGYNNTDANLAAALGYVAADSELYDRIEKSKIGYDFVTPVTRETYRRLEVTQMYRLEDGTYAAKLVFDVDQTIVYVNRTYKGEISLHITGSGDSMKIRDMVIVSE